MSSTMFGSGFFEVALVVICAAAVGVVARLLKQPLVLAYLVTGVLFAALRVFDFDGHEVFRLFSDLGIVFLLFLIGLEINYTSLRAVGRTSLIVGLGQIVFTSVFGFLIARAFHLDFLPSAYIAIALTFSSTVIVLKLLSDRRDIQSLYGKISIGFLLVQDFVAIILLLVLGGLAAGREAPWYLTVFTVVQGVALFGLMTWLGRRVLPYVFDRAARSQELLFLISLAWLFFVVVVAQKLGFSIEIGGFLAGLALANSAEHFQIAGRMRPLRDFFILVFFVLLGASLTFSSFAGLWLPIIVFSLFVLVGNPLIVLALMGLLGYRKRTSFLTGLTVAQISEFSLILMAMGLKVGHVGEEAVALVTAVGVITIAASAYLITYADTLFGWLAPALSYFQKKKTFETSISRSQGRPSVLVIGCHRTGQNIVASLPKEEVLVVDFDPDVIKDLVRRGYGCVYGDIRDPELLEDLDLEGVTLVVSTSPDIEDNLALMSYLAALPRRPKIVVRAETEEDAAALYEKGADYVLLPHFTAGQYLAKTIGVDPEMRLLHRLREQDLKTMKKAVLKDVV